MKNIEIPTKRGILLDSILYKKTIYSNINIKAISWIHAQVERNPFYDNIGFTLNEGNIDFICAHKYNAIKKITKKKYINRQRRNIWFM